MTYVLAFVFVASLATPSLALADTPASETSIESREQRLLELFASRNFEGALGVARGLHEETQDPVYLRAMARCHEGLGAFATAVFLFEKYLLSPTLSNEQRLDTDQRIDLLKVRMVSPPKKTTANPAPLPKEPANIPPQAAAPVSRVPTLFVFKPPEWAAITGLVATSTLAVAAIATGVAANNKFDGLEISCGQTAQGCAADDIDSVSRRAHWANVFWILTGISAAATGMVFAIDYNYKEQHTGVSVAGRF